MHSNEDPAQPKKNNDKFFLKIFFVFVQLLCHVQLFETPWTTACQASLSITNSLSLLKLTSIKLVRPSNHLILCCPLLLPPSIFLSSGSFLMSQFFTSGGQTTGVSASTSVLPMKIQGSFPLGWIGWISSQESSPTPHFKSISSSVLRFLYSPILTSTPDYWKKHSLD